MTGILYTTADTGAIIRQVTSEWETMAHSAMPDHSLRRYFSCQLTALLALPVDEPAVRELLDHLLAYFPRFIDTGLFAPESYRSRLLEKLSPQLRLLKTMTGDTATALQEYLTELENTTGSCSFTFQSLRYFEKFVVTLAARPQSASIHRTLLELNFNYLGYVYAYQRSIKSKLDHIPNSSKSIFLHGEMLENQAVPEIPGDGYHADWPSLRAMTGNWLAEQIAVLPHQAALHMKLPLSVSVAQLALLTRLFNEEGGYQEPCLKTIFSFLSAAYTTKKQTEISPGSLSKEYYSPSQVTAAVVRDLLLRMVARINRNFFPVWIAAGAATLFL